MAGLTKEQRAQREAAQKTQIELVVMVTDYQMFPGAPTIANVHPDEALIMRLGTPGRVRTLKIKLF